MRSYLIAGNWKMNVGPAEAGDLVQEIVNQLQPSNGVEVLVCPPFLSLNAALQAAEGKIFVGAQNVHEAESGAYTGEISASMLAEAGVSHVIVGHSERRQFFGETDALVAAKAVKLLEKGLKPIVCVGETLDERQSGRQNEVVGSQVRGSLAGISADDLSQVVLAYEPVWAIGTGETATPQQAQDMHAFIRAELRQLYGDAVADAMLILYGGSMKPDNADELLASEDVDGGLIGGASLKAAAFLHIVEKAVAQVRA